MKWDPLLLTTWALAIRWSLGAQTEYTADGAPTALEKEIRWHLNRARFDTASENRARGTAYADIPGNAGPLAPRQSLTLAARRHSEDMARRNVLQHETLPGSAYYNPTARPGASGSDEKTKRAKSRP